MGGAPARRDRGRMTTKKVGPGPRAGLALLLGVPLLVFGLLHVRALADGGFSLGDATGALSAVVGAALVVVAVVLPWRPRGSRTGERRGGSAPPHPPRRAVFFFPGGHGRTPP